MIIKRPYKEIHLQTFMNEVKEFSEVIRNKVTGILKVDQENEIWTSDLLSVQEELDLMNLYASHDSSLYFPYSVEKYVLAEYKHLPVEKIDFTDHLKVGVKFKKSTYKHPNGRPDRAEYTYLGEKMSRIRWDFEDFPGGLYKKKCWYMAYYKEDGSLGDEFLIGHEEIDATIPNQLEKSINERVQARDSIVGEIKAVLSGALTVALQLSMIDVIILIKPFWDASKVERENFVELATTGWKDYIASPGAVSDYPWFQAPVSTVKDAQGNVVFEEDGVTPQYITGQQYMLFRLGY